MEDPPTSVDYLRHAILYHLQPFPRYADDETVRQYLACVGDNVMEIFKRRWEAARN